MIRRLTSDPLVSRDFAQHWPGRHDVPEGWALAPVAFQANFLNAYGAEHRRLRGMVTPAFGPRRVAAMRTKIQETCDRLADSLAALPPGTVVDLRSAYSLALTMTVICDLFGVPEHLRVQLGLAIDRASDTDVTPEESMGIVAEIAHQLGLLLEYKRAHADGEEDLTSDLLNPPEGQELLNDDDLKATLFVMIGAGYETAVNLITTATHTLLSMPEHLEMVMSGRVQWTDVVEETLRHKGPVNYLPLRYAVEDIDLGEGVVIRQGDPIAINFAAAGRDPALHPEDPNVFDLSRSSKAHLSFGFGPHACLGAHLGRLETEVGLRTLFSRLPGLALAHPGQEPPIVPSFILNGFAELLVVPTPGTPGDAEPAAAGMAAAMAD
jgi:cytochrome P450